VFVKGFGRGEEERRTERRQRERHTKKEQKTSRIHFCVFLWKRMERRATPQVSSQVKGGEQDTLK